MVVRLLGYLGYMAGGHVLEINGVLSVKEAVDRALGERKWEGVLLILNGRIVEDLEESVSEDDELIITLPTAGG